MCDNDDMLENEDVQNDDNDDLSIHDDEIIECLNTIKKEKISVSVCVANIIDDEIILDNGAEISVFRNSQLFHCKYDVDPVVIDGINEDSESIYCASGGDTDFGFSSCFFHTKKNQKYYN